MASKVNGLQIDFTKETIPVNSVKNLVALVKQIDTITPKTIEISFGHSSLKLEMSLIQRINVNAPYETVRFRYLGDLPHEDNNYLRIAHLAIDLVTKAPAFNPLHMTITNDKTQLLIGSFGRMSMSTPQDLYKMLFKAPEFYTVNDSLITEVPLGTFRKSLQEFNDRQTTPLKIGRLFDQIRSSLNSSIC